MKLSRIRIEQFRQFQQPLVIDALEPGLNLFAGPNESGKSTIVAAIRAAFFERHRSGSIDDLRPWGDSSAAPSVEIDFTHRDTPYRLGKSFLAKKRCELRIGNQQLDGAEAEDRIAELLGFRHAGRGASAAEHWGIPGLLWIEQGSAQEIHESVKHATDHLRTALNASLGEIASSGGDDLLASVESQRNALLTPSSGKPRGDYASAIERDSTLAENLQKITAEIASYRQQVDRFATLREEYARDEAAQPWLGFRAQLKAASEQLEAIRGIAQSLQTERQRASQLDANSQLLRDQLDTYAQQEAAVSSRESALAAATLALPDAAALVANLTLLRSEAEQAHQTARAALRQARLEETRSSHARQLVALRSSQQAAEETLARAEAEHARLQVLQREAAASEIRSADLKALQQQHTTLRELKIQQDAAATRIRFRLDAGHSLRLGDEVLRDSGERHLPEAAILHLPGLGEIEIAPGGADLSELRRRNIELADRHAALLQKLGLPSLEAAEVRQREHAQRLADLRSSEATLGALVPQGIDALRRELGVRQAQAAEIESVLRELPAADPDAPAAPSISNAEGADEAARNAVAQIESKLHQAQLAAGTQQSACDAATRELAQARAMLEAADRPLRLAALQKGLVHARAEQSTLATRIESLERELSAARPEIIEQDVERFRRSAEQHEKHHAQRRDELLKLAVELEVGGARGLDERQAELARDHAQAKRRLDELRRRANALDLLLSLLREKRSALTRRLQAPLQKHLDRYLQLLFPQAHLEIGEDLSPGALTRHGANGASSDISSFDALSFGAREQMGVISRLAYADLLREADRPTLIILDDALVHSDDNRLAQMKRLLFDAATRHQILLFTCHPGKWQDMGVVARDIASFR